MDDEYIRKFSKYLNWYSKYGDHSRTHYIYTLADPRTKIVHYVGQTNNPKKRLSAHKAKGKRALRGKEQLDSLTTWLGNLASEGLPPKMDIYKKVVCKNGVNCSPTCENANNVEREVYFFFKNKMNAPLVNDKEPG